MLRFRPPFLHFCVVTFSLMIFVASAKAQDKVLLRMRLQPGQTFDSGFAMEVKSSVTDQNKRTDKVVTAHNEFHDEVLSVDKAGTVKLNITFQSMTMKETDIIDGKVQSVFGYDSTKHSDVTSPPYQSLSALIGKSVVVSISSRGQILKIDAA